MVSGTSLPLGGVSTGALAPMVTTGGAVSIVQVNVAGVGSATADTLTVEGRSSEPCLLIVGVDRTAPESAVRTAIDEHVQAHVDEHAAVR